MLYFCVTVTKIKLKIFCFNYALCKNVSIKKSTKNDLFDLENDLEVKLRGNHLIRLKKFQMLCVMTRGFSGYDICPNSSSFGAKYHSEIQMTSFDLENDLKVKFRGHHLIGHKKFLKTPKFKLNWLNRFKDMTID